MRQYANYGRGKFPAGSELSWTIMSGEIYSIRTKIVLLLDMLGGYAQKQKPILRDNSYVMEKIGVSGRTVRRFIQKGELPVHKVINKMNYYLDEDVEDLRRRYRGN